MAAAHAWERQPTESIEAFHAFAHYRDLAPDTRSVAAAYTAHSTTCLGRPREKKAARGWEEWSSRHNWVGRMRAYDAQLERQKVKARMKAIAEMEEETARQAANARRILLQPLQALAKSIQKNPELLTADTNAQAMRLGRLAAESVKALKAAVEIERLSRGVSTQNIDQHVTQTDGTQLNDITLDSRAAAIAYSQLLVALADSSVGTGGAGDDSVEGQVVAREAPGLPESEADGLGSPADSAAAHHGAAATREIDPQ